MRNIKKLQNLAGLTQALKSQVLERAKEKAWDSGREEETKYLAREMFSRADSATRLLGDDGFDRFDRFLWKTRNLPDNELWQVEQKMQRAFRRWLEHAGLELLWQEGHG